MISVYDDGKYQYKYNETDRTISMFQRTNMGIFKNIVFDVEEFMALKDEKLKEVKTIIRMLAM